MGDDHPSMGWKELGIPLGEFVGGLAALCAARPLGSVFLTVFGLGVTVVGMGGLTRRLSKPQARPYLTHDEHAYQ